MCGLIFIARKDGKRASRIVRKRYNAQRERGSQGFGYIAIKGDRIVSYRRDIDEAPIMRELLQEDAECIMFHHRMPTSTDNYEEAAHPIIVSNKELAHQYAVIHNGVISNALELKKKHEGLGYQYVTEGEKAIVTKKNTYIVRGGDMFNDSESLAIELARFIDGKCDKIDITGSAAFVVIEYQGDKAIAVHFGHNYTSPLFMVNNDNYFSLLSKGSGEEVKEHALCTLKDGVVTERDLTIGYRYEPTSPYYPHTPWKGEYKRLGTNKTLDEALNDVRAKYSKDGLGENWEGSPVKKSKELTDYELEAEFDTIQELEDDIKGLRMDFYRAQREGRDDRADELLEDIMATEAELEAHNEAIGYGTPKTGYHNG